MPRLRLGIGLLTIVAFSQEQAAVFLRPSEYILPSGSTYPEAEWEKWVSAEAAGYSSARLDVLRAWLKTHETTGMMVVAGGRVLFEYGNVTETSKIGSVRKSVLGMLFGKYLARSPKLLHATVKDLGLDDMDTRLIRILESTLWRLIGPETACLPSPAVIGPKPYL